MRADYPQWLERQGYVAGTVTSQTHRVGRVEKYHGNLDEHFAQDGCSAVIEKFRYSTEDQRQNRKNPSLIPIDGDLRTNLTSYRIAVEWYRGFLGGGTAQATGSVREPVASVVEQLEADVESQRVGLERDLQASLRRAIEQLEPGLEIIDRGIERIVPSGRVDITAIDASGAVVIIELKAGNAGRNAVGQIMSYMGDVSTMDPDRQVRGILVAGDFDTKAISAARVVPGLMLKRYAIRFSITDA